MSKVKHTFLLVDDKKYQQYMVSNIAMLWNLTDKFQLIQQSVTFVPYLQVIHDYYKDEQTL